MPKMTQPRQPRAVTRSFRSEAALRDAIVELCRKDLREALGFEPTQEWLDGWRREFKRLRSQERKARRRVSEAREKPHLFVRRTWAFLARECRLGRLGPTACALFEYLVEHGDDEGDDEGKPIILPSLEFIPDDLGKRVVRPRRRLPKRYHGLTVAQLQMTDLSIIGTPLKKDLRDGRNALANIATPKGFVIWALERAARLHPRGWTLSAASGAPRVEEPDMEQEVIHLSARLLTRLAFLLFPMDYGSNLGPAGVERFLEQGGTAKQVLQTYLRSISRMKKQFGLPSVRIDPPPGWSLPGKPFSWKDWFASEDYKTARAELIARLTYEGDGAVSGKKSARRRGPRGQPEAGPWPIRLADP